MANQLRKLKRRQLLELLLVQGKELEALKKELQSAREQISGMESRLSKMGEPVRTDPARHGRDIEEILAEAREEASEQE